MIQLKPILQTPPANCPHCGAPLAAKDFTIVGMRNLTDYTCPACGDEFYGDLPAGQALYTPVLLDKKTGALYGGKSAEWFADWLAKSFQNRTNQSVSFEVRELSRVKDKVVLLNCLDTLYGHSLLKLLNAQYYIDHKTDHSLIVIAPPFLEWLLPAGLTQAWIVDLPLRRGTEWNDWLAAEINRKIAGFAEVHLSVAFSHPHPSDFDIERFTDVAPFKLSKFGAFNDAPVVTFIWREDRLWENETSSGRIKRSFGFRGNNVAGQIEKIVRFAEILRVGNPKLDFAIAGLGSTGSFPEWIKDLRKNSLDESDERAWCERYAASHAVVGVHGSNMLLPSAHAGGVVELLPADRQGNFLQDILVRPSDARETLFRYRFTPLSTAPEELAEIVSVLLRYEDFRQLMGDEFSRHRAKYDLEKWRQA